MTVQVDESLHKERLLKNMAAPSYSQGLANLTKKRNYVRTNPIFNIAESAIFDRDHEYSVTKKGPAVYDHTLPTASNR